MPDIPIHFDDDCPDEVTDLDRETQFTASDEDFETDFHEDGDVHGFFDDDFDEDDNDLYDEELAALEGDDFDEDDE